MTKRTLTAAAVAATLAAACATSATAQTIRYRVTSDVTGTWTEAVRADLDADDADHDGTEEVAVRDSTVRFALTAAMADVALTDGRVRAAVHDVATTSLTQEVASTYVDFYGTTGTCGPQSADASGAGTIVSAGTGLLLRPSSDALLEIECTDGRGRFSMSVDLLRVAASNVVPELGGAPLDVAFTLPRASFGDWRIAVPVAASAAQRTFERCPREDPGHTVACGLDWSGTVVLERLTPQVTAARVVGDRALVDVRCGGPCTPRLGVAGAQRTYRMAAAGTQRLSLPLSARARRLVADGGRLRLTARFGDERAVVTLR